MKHQITAKDKETGEIRSFVFTGDLFGSSLLVEEITKIAEINCVKTPLVMVGTFGGAMILLKSADQRLAEDCVATLKRVPEFGK